MSQDSRQIERLRWNIRTVRSYVLKALDELESQVAEMAQPEEQGGDWKTAWKQYEAGKK